VALVTGADVYRYRPDLADKPIWRCESCGAYTGCHPGTTKRVGRLANAKTRALKVAAHAAFDPMWQREGMSRTAAYRWLREQTGLPERDCHIGWMDDETLRRIPQLCAALTGASA
jgi:hypothetical protein